MELADSDSKHIKSSLLAAFSLNWVQYLSFYYYYFFFYFIFLNVLYACFSDGVFGMIPQTAGLEIDLG